MAESLAHKFGQIIGDMLELTIQPSLERFAKINKLYLDKKSSRKTRKGKKVSWFDLNDNKHDLDFVIERNGNENTIGSPVAFIEIAWRRYTKHSKNKAQEIQGAILPLAEKYKNNSPFKGVVLAGEFTNGALSQLKSLGFCVLYFPYSTVIKAFAKSGIDASSNETTTEKEFREKIEAWHNLPDKHAISKEMVRLNKKEVAHFILSLSNSITRRVEQITILPLHGNQSQVSSVTEAITFLRAYSEQIGYLPLLKYDVIIKYNNSDRIEASFHDKKDAISFLEGYS
jgi:hypothetical protein